MIVCIDHILMKFISKDLRGSVVLESLIAT